MMPFFLVAAACCAPIAVAAVVAMAGLRSKGDESEAKARTDLRDSEESPSRLTSSEERS